MAPRERETPVRIIVKKKAAHGPHHGGAWKVAFADFMTAMFALFLVLWIMTQSSSIRAAIAGYFQDPLGRATEFGSSILPGEGAQASSPRPINEPQTTDLRRDRLRQLGDRIRRRLAASAELKDLAKYIEITLTDEGLRIELIEDSSGVFFQSGDAQPSRKGAELLALLGSELGTMDNAILVEGHTDARPYASKRGYSNWELSADRANTARRIMSANGLREGQVEQVRGFADRDLKYKDNPLDQRNRRVTITMRLADAHPTAPAAVAPAGAPDSAHRGASPGGRR